MLGILHLKCPQNDDRLTGGCFEAQLDLGFDFALTRNLCMQPARHGIYLKDGSAEAESLDFLARRSTSRSMYVYLWVMYKTLARSGVWWQVSRAGLFQALNHSLRLSQSTVSSQSALSN